VAATLLLLAGFGQIDGLTILPAVVILCREILVSGLREYLAEIRVGLPVSALAKWKTLLQMFSIAFLIVGTSGPAFLPTRAIGEAGLWIAAGLTLITGYDYLRASLHHITGVAKPDPVVRAGPPKEAWQADGRAEERRQR